MTELFTPVQAAETNKNNEENEISADTPDQLPEADVDADFNLEDLPEFIEPIVLSPFNVRLNSLALEAKAGDMRAKEELLKTLLPYIKHISKKYNAKDYSYEDFVQEATLSCLKAIEKYKPERKMPFSQFAQMAINADLKNILTFSHREMRDAEKHNLSEVSLDHPDSYTGQNIEVSHLDVGFEEIEKETPEDAIDMVKYGTHYDFVSRLGMSDLEAQTIILIRSNLTYQEIGEKLLNDGSKTGRKTIDNARQRAVTKLHKYRANQTN